MEGVKVSCFEWPSLRANWRDQAKDSEAPSRAEIKFGGKYIKLVIDTVKYKMPHQGVPGVPALSVAVR